MIGYELLSGARPFTGPDYRDQHLNKHPGPLTGIPDSLGALVEECLYKAPGARPGPAAIHSRLERATAAASSRGVARLQEANRANVIRHGEIGRQASALQSEADRRQELANVAVQALERIAKTLRDVITDSAPSASLSTGLEVGWTIALNRAELRLAPPMTAPPNPCGARGKPAFEVIAFSELNLNMTADRLGYQGRSHSLWYCDAQEAGRYQWFETAFMTPGIRLAMTRQEPFALKPGEDAASAFAVAWPDRAQIAWPFTPLSVGELDNFMSRWTEWFADASKENSPGPVPFPNDPLGKAGGNAEARGAGHGSGPSSTPGRRIAYVTVPPGPGATATAAVTTCPAAPVTGSPLVMPSRSNSSRYATTFSASLRCPDLETMQDWISRWAAFRILAVAPAPGDR